MQDCNLKHLQGWFILALLVFSCSNSAASSGSVDALEATIITEDAERFASVFAKGKSALKPSTLQSEYIELGTYGVEIFTPNRLVDAENLSEAIKNDYELYKRGVEICLPAAQAGATAVRSIFLAYEGLLGTPSLPSVYAIFGANNSGGTIGGEEDAYAIVLGLEVVCRVAEGDTPEVEQWLKNYIAHETAHTQQLFAEEPTLISQILIEGGADFIGSLVSGQTLNAKLEHWARPKEKEIWQLFQKHMNDEDYNGFSPWLYTAKPDNGWPMDVGYWLGAQIAASYFEQASDKRQAIRDILNAAVNPETFLKESGYANKFE